MAARNITYEASQFMTKFATYKANHVYVSNHNARYAAGEVTFDLELNDHADLTIAEYRAKLGYRSHRRAADATLDTTKPPPGFDWVCTVFGYDCDSSSSSSSSSTGSSLLSSSSSSSAATPVPPPPHHKSSSSSTGSHRMSSSSSSQAPAVHSSSTGSPSPKPASGMDWRGSGKLGDVKDQGQCGSCWSFASTASMQGAWALKSGNLLSFSEQQLIDCVNNGQNTCDQGGSFQDSWKYMIGSSAAHPELETSYKYTATSGNQCAYAASAATVATFSSSTDLPSGDEGALATASNTRPAIAVAIDASTQNFQLYKSGVLVDTQCGSDVASLDHAVTVVGYGTDSATSTDYFLVQNSWGTTWGMNGYVMMKRGSNMCGIATDASYIIA